MNFNKKEREDVMIKTRLPFDTFDLPVTEFRRGYDSAVYFWRLKRILENEGIKKKALMQVFSRVNGATVCGIDEAIAVLKVGTGHWKDYNKMHPLFDRYIELKALLRSANTRQDFESVVKIMLQKIELQQELNSLWVSTFDDLEIKALYDGDKIDPWKAVMTIEGQASEFAHLESVYLGILARGTRVATNTRSVVDAAKGKPILFFADRFDLFSNQTADGYAAYKAGALGVATDAMGAWWGAGGLGTNPHALIAIYDGNTVEATLAFKRNYPNEKTISLVDFHNDCVGTSIAVARAFRERGMKLDGVRLDTSGNMVDKSIRPEMMGKFKPTGVCAPLVYNVRKALDEEGFNYVEIVVSGGFNPTRIAEFEANGVPVNAYGVGSSLFNGEDGKFDYTADIVIVDGKPMAKVGREFNPDPRLELVRG
jgi:nicotinate phosphoribosyltransferase